MKAVLVKKPGGADQLHLDDVEKPLPGSHQVLIKVFATAVNRADILQVTRTVVFVHKCGHIFKHLSCTQCLLV